MANFKVVIRDTAVFDSAEAYYFYEQCVSGLGERFLSELEKIYTTLSKRPLSYGYTDGQETMIFRDVRLPHFPYLVIFEIINNEVYVHAVFHARKHPSAKWSFKEIPTSRR
jgi:hypothetical protein